MVLLPVARYPSVNANLVVSVIAFHVNIQNLQQKSLQIRDTVSGPLNACNKVASINKA